MKIAAITRFKHGHLWEAKERLGISAKKLAKKTGLSYGVLLDFLSLTRRPTLEQAEKLMKFFVKFDIVVDLELWWPKEFNPLKSAMTITQLADIPDELLSAGLIQTALPPDQALMQKEEGFSAVFATLEEREQEVLEARFFDSETFEQVGKRIHVSRERVRQIEAKALRKLRHPSRLCLLEGQASELGIGSLNSKELLNRELEKSKKITDSLFMYHGWHFHKRTGPLKSELKRWIATKIIGSDVYHLFASAADYVKIAIDIENKKNGIETSLPKPATIEA